jgi:hypothetical protein
MNARITPFSVARPLVAGVICLLLVGLLLAEPSRVQAAPAEGVAVSAPVSTAGVASGPVFATWYQDVLGNQTRMIQVATLFMIAGIILLMWTRGK